MKLSRCLGVGLLTVGAWLPLCAFEQIEGPSVVLGEGASHSTSRLSYSPDSSQILLPFTGGTFVVDSSDGSLADVWEGKFDALYVGDRGVAYVTRMPGEYAQTHVELNEANGSRSYIIPAALPFAASRDGSVLALLASDPVDLAELILWDVDEERELSSIPFMPGRLYATIHVVALSPDGSKLITHLVGEDFVQVRSTETGEVLWQKEGPRFESAAFLNDNQGFILGGELSVPDPESAGGYRTSYMAGFTLQSEAPLFVVEDLFEQSEPPKRPSQFIVGVDSTADRFVAESEGSLFLVDVASGEILWEEPYTDYAFDVHFAPDGSQFSMAVSINNEIHMKAFDASTGAELWSFEVPETVYNLRGAEVGEQPTPPDPESGQLKFESRSKTVRVWDRDGVLILGLEGVEAELNLPEQGAGTPTRFYKFGTTDSDKTLRGLGNSETIWMGGIYLRAVYEWDLNEADPQPVLLWDKLPSNSQTSSDDLGVILSRVSNTGFELWRLDDQSVRTINVLSSASPGVSPLGNWVIWHDGKTATIVDAHTAELYKEIEFSSTPVSGRPYWALPMSADDRFMMVGNLNGDLDLWHLESGAHLARISPFAASSAGFVDGATVYTQFRGRTEFWDVSDATSVKQMESLKQALGRINDSAKGYYRSKWLGWFWPGDFVGDYGWIWHTQNGWSYLTGGNEQVWMWLEQAPQGWFWADGGLYPWVYSSALGRWVAIGEFSDGFTVYFWDPETGTWLTGERNGELSNWSNGVMGNLKGRGAPYPAVEVACVA